MIDLRSDTTTLPSQEMLESVLNAPMGDDGRVDANGRGEDPTVNALEDLAAKLTGKEAALLFPTGTLANTTAILTHCQAGDRILVDPIMHIVKSEKIVFDPQFGQMEAVYYPTDDEQQPDFKAITHILDNEKIQLLCVEDSHNFHGGTVFNRSSLKQLIQLRERYQIPIHMDGARLFNASVGSGISPEEMCRSVDSLMFCLSKGLAAPIGSILCGSREFIAKARNMRKLLGGGMRQAGLIAAPGLVALKSYREYLEADHALCREVYQGLKNLDYIKIKHAVESNIIMLDITATGLSQAEFCERAKQRGLLIRPVLDDSVRLVFHRDVARDAAPIIIEIITSLDQQR